MFTPYNKNRIRIDRDARMFHHYTIPHGILCETIRGRIEEKKDATILITGRTGEGKSTLGAKLCFDHFEHMDNPLDSEEKMYTDDNFIIDPEDYAKRMITDRGTVLFWDESRDGLSSKNWNQQINKTIVSRKNKNRKRGIVSLILLPHEGEVDKSFLKHITMWIWIKKRQIAHVFVAANARMGGHGLSIPAIIDRQNKWLKENLSRREVPPTIHPEYIGSIVFGALTKKQEKRYDALVEKHQATGKLTDKEKANLNPIVDQKELEKQIPMMLDKVEAGEIKTKRELWEKLKEATQFDERKLKTSINFHLKIRGLKNFNTLEI